MSALLKKASSKLFLLLFLCGYIGGIVTVLGVKTSYVAVFGVTALLMYTQLPTYMDSKVFNACLFPGLFIGTVISSQVLMSQLFIGFKLLVLLIYLVATLFLLAPGLLGKSYVPFLFLFALNLGVPGDVTQQLLAALLVGISVSAVYLFHHKKEAHIPLTKSSFAPFLKACQKHKKFLLLLGVGTALFSVIGLMIRDTRFVWIGVTLMSVLELEWQDTRKKMFHRLLGTVLGIGLLGIIYTILPTGLLPIFFLGFNYAYMFVEDYLIKMIFITVNSIKANMVMFQMSLPILIWQRFIFVSIGIGIVLFLMGSVASYRKIARS